MKDCSIPASTVSASSARPPSCTATWPSTKMWSCAAVTPTAASCSRQGSFRSGVFFMPGQELLKRLGDNNKQISTYYEGHLNPKPEIPRLIWPCREMNPGFRGRRRAPLKRDSRTASYLQFGTSTVPILFVSCLFGIYFLFIETS